MIVQNVEFESFDVQTGVDETGVATEMLSLNSTVAITYVFYCSRLGVASGPVCFIFSF